MVASEKKADSSRYSNVNIFKSLKGVSHQHSHFVDVRAKGQIFEGYDFSYCVFVRAYFHNSTFSNCKFTGSNFVDCNFRNAKLRDCDFSYANFNGTRIPTDQIVNNLPPQPNIRSELLQLLRRNAVSMGDYKSEKKFVIHEINATKEHYRRAWKNDETYYRKKYPGLKKYIAGLKLIGLKLDNFFWGHGERVWMSVVSISFLILIISFISVFVSSVGFDEMKISTLMDKFGKYFLYNMNLLLGMDNDEKIKKILYLDWIVVVVRFVAIGVIVSALYRRLSHR